jgi:hypothetical protein
MKRLGLVLLVVLAFLAQTPAPSYTRIDLTAGETGRKLFSAVLRDGERAVLRWKNSLFGLDVTEVFQAQQGAMILDEVTFADSGGPAPPEVAPEDVEDLYHTGGPFTARGLNKSFRRVVYRVAEVGNPKMRIREHELAFKQEVGFGGVVVLTAAVPTWLEVFHP